VHLVYLFGKYTCPKGMDTIHTLGQKRLHIVEGVGNPDTLSSTRREVDRVEQNLGLPPHCGPTGAVALMRSFAACCAAACWALVA
jgi:hypothetical protein